MPTKRRHRLAPMRQDFWDLDANLEYELLTGRALIPACGFASEEDMRAAWDQHRDRLLAEWIKEKPCSRPFGWWKFEGVPRHGERPIICERFEAKYKPNWEKHGILHTNTVPPIQEPERDFLRRHGELAEEELLLFSNAAPE
jgi:hypothetical protein